MTKYILLFLSLSLLFFASCTTLYFKQPIPFDAKTIYYMPKEIRGEWRKDSDALIIDEKKWISQQLDSLGNITTKVEYEISDSLVVKRVRGYYFFNLLETNGYWTPNLGFRHRNLFLIKRLSSSDTLTLKNVLDFIPDSVTTSKDYYYSKPMSRRQAKQFVEKGGFSDTLIVFDLKTRTILK